MPTRAVCAPSAKSVDSDLSALRDLCDQRCSTREGIYRPQAASLALTELEQLKYENLETRMQLLRLRQEKLAREWEELRRQQQELEAAIPALLREILKAHGHSDGSLDLKRCHVIPKPAQTAEKQEAKQ